MLTVFPNFSATGIKGQILDAFFLSESISGTLVQKLLPCDALFHPVEGYRQTEIQFLVVYRVNMDELSWGMSSRITQFLTFSAIFI